MPSAKAALYLRSSKDRSDVSINAQRRELQALALSRDLLIVQEYNDVVESAKDEHRPGFQQLLRELKAATRIWTVLLLTDTSRLSRNIYIAEVFKHEADKRGVRIVYAKLPESNPIMDMMMLQMMRAFDQMHSMLSKEKGLAGMAENVRQGYRAGGRAPLGYRLEHIDTGTIREGLPVMKSRLVLAENAAKVGDYLRQRAAGGARRNLIRALELSIPDSTLIGVEWNALTYAGHTVWNVHNETRPGGYKGGTKRRPRAEWVIERDTHPALITTAEAEAILAHFDNSAASHGRRTVATYLLTGVLKTPENGPWHGDGSGLYYRAGKGKKVRAEEIDRAVLGKIGRDLKSPAFVKTLLEQARKQAVKLDTGKELAQQRTAIKTINVRIAKFADMAADMEQPRAMLDKIEGLERERGVLEKAMADADRLHRGAQAMGTITESDVHRLLDNLAETMQDSERETLKDFVAGLVEAIYLNPADLTCRIHYRIPAKRGDKVASPRGFDSIPPFCAISSLKIAWPTIACRTA